MFPYSLRYLWYERPGMNASDMDAPGRDASARRPSAFVLYLFFRTAQRAVPTAVPTIVPIAVLYRNLYLIFLFLKGEQYKVDVLVTDDQFPRNFKPHIHNMMQLRLQLFLRSHRHDQRLRDNHEGSKPSLRATC